jgi:hypothetical protein
MNHSVSIAGKIEFFTVRVNPVCAAGDAAVDAHPQPQSWLRDGHRPSTRFLRPTDVQLRTDFAQAGPAHPHIDVTGRTITSTSV